MLHTQNLRRLLWASLLPIGLFAGWLTYQYVSVQQAAKRTHAVAELALVIADLASAATNVRDASLMRSREEEGQIFTTIRQGANVELARHVQRVDRAIDGLGKTNTVLRRPWAAWRSDWQRLSVGTTSRTDAFGQFFRLSALINELRTMTLVIGFGVNQQVHSDERNLAIRELVETAGIDLANYVGQLRALSAFEGSGVALTARIAALNMDIKRSRNHIELLTEQGMSLSSVRQQLDSIGQYSDAVAQLRMDGAVNSEEMYRRFRLGSQGLELTLAYRNELNQIRNSEIDRLISGQEHRLLALLFVASLVALLLIFVFRQIMRSRLSQEATTERLSLVIEAAKVGIWSRDLKLNEFYWSDELRRILRLSSEEQPQSLMRYVHPDDVQEVERRMTRLLGLSLGDPDNSERLDVRFICGDGESRWMQTLLTKDQLPNGHAGFLGLMIDVQQSYADQANLSSALEQLEARNEELRHFARSTAHDLLEPARMVASFGALLKEEVGSSLSQSQEQYLDFMLEGSTRSAQVLNDMQAYLSMGHLGEPKVVDLQAVTQAGVDRLRERIAGDQPDIEVGPLPKVLGHRSALEKLMQNLLSNAVKFTEPGCTAAVSVSCESSAQRCLVKVKDSGIGVAPEYCEAVFRPFNRLNVRAKYEGTGLGLSLCRRAVELCGGRIWLESSADQGSCVYVDLPVAPAA